MATDPTISIPVTTGSPALEEEIPSPEAELSWVTVAEGERDHPRTSEAPLRVRRLVLQMLASALVVLIGVAIGGTLAAQRLAEREAVNDAATMADILAEAVVIPSLTNELATGQSAAVAAFDQVVRNRILGPDVVRVKLWGPDGTVLYADEPQLIGQRFALDPAQEEVLADPATHAEVSDLDRSENEFETADKLLEVYRPVWAPDGTEVLFEVYAPYDQVGARATQLWRGFAGVTLTSLLLLLVLLAPVVWHLLGRIRRAQRHREVLLERAVDASAEERRRIAASLHDGPVQELVASSFAVAGAGERAEAAGHRALATELRAASATVRTSIRALRTLLVDIYPASLARSGLAIALADLAASLQREGIDIHTDVEPDGVLGLGQEGERLVYRVAQECLRNVARHAAPCTATLSLYREDDSVVLDVVDDGTGFDPALLDTKPEGGHFGVSAMADLAAASGALLQVASAPGRGTHWRLSVPLDRKGERR